MSFNYPENTVHYQNLFKDIIIADQEKYIDEFNNELMDRLEKSSARYAGLPVPFLYNPFILNRKDFSFLQGLLDKFNVILHKIIEHYLKDKDFRKLFPFSDEMEQYILIDPGYKSFYPIARFDIFWQNKGQIKFCELNTDGTSAMNEVRVVQEIVLNSMAVKELNTAMGFSLKGFELFDSWLDTMFKVYDESIFEKHTARPTVAIMDFEGEGTVSEFEEFQKYMAKRDIISYIVDPREFEYKSKKLYYKDNPVDLVYRRATMERLFDRYDEITPLLKAYQEKAFCMCGSFRSQIIHNKAIFSVLSRPEDLPFLSNEEVDFILKHIPKTGLLEENNHFSHDIYRQKDSYLLKPCDKFACKGVVPGCDVTQDSWNEHLKNNQGKNYLYQEYCRPPRLEMLHISGNNASFREFNYIIGLFLYDNKLMGMYNRAGTKNIIGSVIECYVVPVYLMA